MMKNGLIRVIIRELQRIAQKPLYWSGLMIVPILIMVLISRIYHQRVLMDLPVAVVDHDQTMTSRKIIRMLDLHRTMAVRYQEMEIPQAQTLMEKNQIMAFVVIPADFEKQIKTGKKATLQVYSFGANLVVGNMIYKAIVEVAGEFGGRIALSRLVADRGESAVTLHSWPPLNMDVHNLYNPTFDYKNFLPLGAIVTMIQMIFIIVLVMAFAGEKLDNSETEWYLSAGGKELVAHVGKGIPAMAFLVLLGVFLFGPFFQLAGITVRGNLAILGGLWIWFGLNILMISIIIKNIFPEPMLSLEAAVFLTAPAFAFSGYTFPLNEFPALHRWFAYTMPSTHFLPLLVQQVVMGSPVSYMGSSIKWAALYTAALCLVAVISRFVPFYLTKHDEKRKENNAQ